jgi:hypothetical protein
MEERFGRKVGLEGGGEEGEGGRENNNMMG